MILPPFPAKKRAVRGATVGLGNLARFLVKPLEKNNDTNR
jgi:hypothetical protein